jgi:predicted amidohydrolase YtcJ
LTTVGDRAVTAGDAALFEKLKASGRLPVRVVLTWRPSSSRPLEEVIKEIEASPWTTNLGDEWLKWGTFKVTLDGGQSVGTAYQRVPYGPFGRQLYGQTNPDARGTLFVPLDKLIGIMRAARNKGWQLTAHAQGGGAIDTLIDAFEELDKEKSIAPTRSHVMHGSFQSPEAIARMRKLGVIADAQAMWLYLDAPALERVFGHDGMRYFFPLRTYLEHGVIVAGGSDHMIGHDKDKAVNPYNPFLSMWASMVRRTTEGKVLFPEQRITREEALKMYTVWPAFLQFSEKTKGSIEAGKLADLTVIDRDYMTCPEEEIRNLQTVMTVLDGKVVYER